MTTIRQHTKKERKKKKKKHTVRVQWVAWDCYFWQSFLCLMLQCITIRLRSWEIGLEWLCVCVCVCTCACVYWWVCWLFTWDVIINGGQCLTFVHVLPVSGITFVLSLFCALQLPHFLPGYSLSVSTVTLSLTFCPFFFCYMCVCNQVCEDFVWSCECGVAHWWSLRGGLSQDWPLMSSLSSWRSLMSVVSHQSGLLSGWSFANMVYHQRSLFKLQGGLLSE